MIQTKGFEFSPGPGASFALAQPTPLQFVSGQSLVPDSGASVVFDAAREATRNLVSGINVGLGSILEGVTTVVKESREDKRAEKEHERALELIRERASYGDMLSPYEEARLDYLKAQTKKLGQETEESPYSEWSSGYENVPQEAPLSGTTPPPAGDVTIPVPDMPKVEPPLPGEDEEQPLVPLAEVDERLPEVQQPPSAPLADTTGPRKIVQTGPILQIPLEDGGTWIVDTEAAKRGQSTGKYIGPGMDTPEDLQNPPGFETTRMTVGPTGRVSRTLEPKAPEGGPTMSPEQLKAWNTIENRVKANTSIQNANDAVASRDIIGSNLAQENGLSDITAINAFQRMVDPGVAVREGDVTLIQQAIPRLQRYGLKARNWVVGDQLSPEVRKQMIEAADAMLEARARAAEPSINELRGIAKEVGLNPDSVIKPLTLPESISLKTQIASLAEELDSMEDKNSEEYRTKREQLKQLVRKQQQQ